MLSGTSIRADLNQSKRAPMACIASKTQAGALLRGKTRMPSPDLAQELAFRNPGSVHQVSIPFLTCQPKRQNVREGRMRRVAPLGDAESL